MYVDRYVCMDGRICIYIYIYVCVCMYIAIYELRVYTCMYIIVYYVIFKLCTARDTGRARISEHACLDARALKPHYSAVQYNTRR